MAQVDFGLVIFVTASKAARINYRDTTLACSFLKAHLLSLKNGNHFSVRQLQMLKSSS